MAPGARELVATFLVVAARVATAQQIRLTPPDPAADLLVREALQKTPKIDAALAAVDDAQHRIAILYVSERRSRDLPRPRRGELCRPDAESANSVARETRSGREGNGKRSARGRSVHARPGSAHDRSASPERLV